jgi:hypothetical protein
MHARLVFYLNLKLIRGVPGPQIPTPTDAAFTDHPGAEVRVTSFDVRPLTRAYDEIKNFSSKVP